MARIRIKKAPNSSVPNQMSPGFSGQALQKPSTSTARQLKAVPRDEANIEAERGETALVPNKEGLPAHYNIGGARHTGGGTPLNVPKDTFIFSDTKKMRIKDPMILAEFGKAKGSYTPADLAKKYNINKFRKILGDPDSDHLDVDTAEKMIANYNLKLGKLALVQESKKGFPQGIPAVAMPYLSTFNIQPDSILPLKAEEEMGQEGPPQGMPMAKYGRILRKAQNGNQGQYVDLGDPSQDPKSLWDYPGNEAFQPSPVSYDSSNANYMQSFKPGTPGATTSNEMAVNAIGNNPGDQVSNPSIYSKGTAKTGIKLYGEEAAAWGIAGGDLLTNIFSQDEKRNAEKQLASRFKAENIFASRGDKDRGDYTTNYGYFRPDDQNVGNMVTGAYGGELPIAQDGTIQDADALMEFYAAAMKKRGDKQRAEDYMEKMRDAEKAARREKYYGIGKRTKAEKKIKDTYETLEQLTGKTYLPLGHTKRVLTPEDAYDQYVDAVGEYNKYAPTPKTAFVPGPGMPELYGRPEYEHISAIPATGIPNFSPTRPVVITKDPNVKAAPADATATSTTAVTKEKHGWYKEGTEYVLYEDPNQKTDPNTIKNY